MEGNYDNVQNEVNQYYGLLRQVLRFSNNNIVFNCYWISNDEKLLVDIMLCLPMTKFLFAFLAREKGIIEYSPI